jgi:hypothetical protein
MNSALERTVSVMRNFHAPWGIAGGWALDLFVGRELRPHADIDVAVLRADQLHLRAQLSGRVEKVVAHQLAEWSPTEVLALPVHEVHVTWPDGYQLEFLLNEQDRATNEWVFRRDPRIRRPMPAVFVSSRVPYLAPEIVLLYKAKAPAAKDIEDFCAVVPHLRNDQRVWLRDALDMAAPGHPWASALSQEA